MFGSKNKITGFVTAQIYREAGSLDLCAHEGGRSEESNRGCNLSQIPKRFSTKEWRMTDPRCVTL